MMEEQTRAGMGIILKLLSEACFEITDNSYCWCGEVQHYTTNHVAGLRRLEWRKAGESLKSELERQMNDYVSKTFEDGGVRVDSFFKETPDFYCEPKIQLHANKALGISKQCEQYLKENEDFIPEDIFNALMDQSLKFQEIASGLLSYCFTCPFKALLSSKKMNMKEYFTMEELYKTMRKFHDFREIGVTTSYLAGFLLGEDKSCRYGLDDSWFNKKCAEISSSLGEMREFAGKSPSVAPSLDYLTQQLNCYKEIIENISKIRRMALVIPKISL